MNPELRDFLTDNPRYHDRHPSPAYQARQWRVRDKLSEEDIAALIAGFKAGTAKWLLAERYGINMKSVKKLLREAGVKKTSGGGYTRPFVDKD